MIFNESNNGSNKLNGNFVDMDSLINNVKAEDNRNLRLTKTFQWLYVGMFILYTGMMFFPYPEIPIIKRISQVFFIASMIAFAIIFRYGFKEYKNIDYSLPVIEMLRNAAKRYQFKIKKLLTLLIPIFLLDVGLTLSFYNDLLPLEPLNRVLLIQAIYIPVMTISAVIGYFVWRSRQKPLRDNALKLIEELESN